jgi:hypothetical protein
MAVLAERLSGEGALGFRDYWNVIEGGVAGEDWALVRRYCTRAGDLATADTYRAEHPNNGLSEEDLTNAVNERVGMLLVKDAWARANQGEVDEALMDFARADGMIPRYYFDIPEYGLNVHWANTLMMKGEFERAIDLLSMDALVMRNEEALAALKQAYIGAYEGGSDFEAWADDLHRQVARKLDEFEMPDYQGERHAFADLRDEVTLVTLWFPT